jgi:prepilin-type N-terminal cleavage/methylation domain-containing protein
VHLQTRRRGGGFSLVELMIVVVVLGILAGLASVGYRRYIARARTAEAVAMLAEMVSKEQVYYLEFAQYLPLDNKATDPPTATTPSGVASEAATSFYPRDPSVSTFDSVRTAQALGVLPKSWQYVAIRPKDNVLYCTYFLGSGATGSSPPASGTLGATLLGTAAIGQPWFYALAACNLLKTASWPSGVTVFTLTYNAPTLKTIYEGQ